MTSRQKPLTEREAARQIFGRFLDHVYSVRPRKLASSVQPPKGMIEDYHNPFAKGV